MRVNESIAVSTTRVLLVPYEASHVITYHEWMKDEKIQESTASEPLSLPEEYAMQANWRTSHDKLTFIACQPLSSETRSISGRIDDIPERMLGDVNLFLSHDDDDEDEDEDSDDEKKGLKALIGELELMIAPTDKRRQGYGRATIMAFLYYIARNIDTVVSEFNSQEARKSDKIRLRVKIGKDNQASLTLFESLGFKKVTEEPNYFGELELCLNDSSDGKSWMEGLSDGASKDGYAELSYLPDNSSVDTS